MKQPYPIEHETEQQFLDRCMIDDYMNEEYRLTAQRKAMSYQIWKNKK